MTIEPWVTVAELPAQRPDLTDDEWDRLAAAATQVLYHLSGGRWAGRRRRTLEVHAPQSSGYRPGALLDRAYLWEGVCLGGAHDCCTCPSSLRLPGYPVVEVHSVEQAGVVRDPATYRVWSRRFLETLGGAPWPTCSGVLVDYTSGREPPAGAIEAVVDYTLALGEARIDPERSRLPNNAKTITRQGVSITYNTALDFTNAGKVGVAAVDTWLAAVNPTGRRGRASSWSPDTDSRFYAQPTAP